MLVCVNLYHVASFKKILRFFKKNTKIYLYAIIYLKLRIGVKQMFRFKKLEIDNKKYILKINGDHAEAIAVHHNGKYKSSISLPKINYKEIANQCEDLANGDIQQLGYLTSNNSSLQLINSTIRLDSSFLLENQSYVEDIDVVKSLLEVAYDKNKGLVVFDNNGEIQKHLKSKDIDFELYNKANLRIKYGDLNERILLDVLNLSTQEQSIIASFIQYKQLNKGNADIGIPVLDGSNWLYDLFIVEPSTLAQQFKIKEYTIKMLKTSLLQLTMNGIVSQEHSNVKQIIQSAENGRIVVIDIRDQDKKLVKATLSNNSKLDVIVVDNVYHKFDNIQYLLYNTNLFTGTTRDFKSFVLNRNSFALKDELISMQYYLNEIKFLDFEYLIVKEKAFPLIVTNEEYIKNTSMKSIKVNTSTVANFF